MNKKKYNGSFRKKKEEKKAVVCYLLPFIEELCEAKWVKSNENIIPGDWKIPWEQYGHHVITESQDSLAWEVILRVI